MIDHTFNKACNYGAHPMPPACHVEYIAPGDCNTGFSPMPASCTVGLPPPIQSVPEPMTGGLFGAGLVVMLLVMRSRANRRLDAGDHL